jgi:hypothetical protein
LTIFGLVGFVELFSYHLGKTILPLLKDKSIGFLVLNSNAIAFLNKTVLDNLYTYNYRAKLYLATLEI